ncbi:hypothetical protein U9M48_024671, partial [Paspalum notatum var. saurae]
YKLDEEPRGQGASRPAQPHAAADTDADVRSTAQRSTPIHSSAGAGAGCWAAGFDALQLYSGSTSLVTEWLLKWGKSKHSVSHPALQQLQGPQIGEGGGNGNNGNAGIGEGGNDNNGNAGKIYLDFGLMEWLNDYNN